ncbi:tenascin-like [Boleophthalmus pectinirostris]|uniref:tenascin-like n=1 Tax=Boleophthalmus pectinirostris TaxID=150288 RepID=UPI0024330345|nr:tenascin-like [Boleophthalmus pectinirostris]
MDMRRLPGCIFLTFFLALAEAELLKKILRYRRQTVLSSKEHNISLPNTNKSVLFNHVYNIHVPANAPCTMDLDASKHIHPMDAAASAGHSITEHTVSGENQIVFTHRIQIPHQACGCAEDLPVLKDLLNRLEMLEGQVSALKQQCSTGSLCCNTQATGDVETKPYCNGHGHFSAEMCRCMCEPGWKGPNCTQSECPQNCGDKGRCVQGICECFKGFSGEDCSVETCPVPCGPHGQCVGGLCVCSDGFFGEDCAHTKCLNNCFGHGRCVDGNCICSHPWSGVDCAEVTCPKNCSDNGHCVNGTCFCDEGYTGLDCGARTCFNNCHGNGFCVKGRCVCTAGYSGEDCSQLTCLNDCSGRGSCFNGVCICNVGYQGEDCSQLACLNNCNMRGQCINGQCACDVGFQGEDCSELSCPSSCHHRGRCMNGQCVCHEGFTGEDCSIRTCPSNCFSRGTCINGLCSCYTGFSGQDCSQLSCPNSCKHRGSCIDGQCICKEGFTGEDCSQRACPNDCMKRGYCLDGTCICQEGYFGDDCSGLVCPNNCNNRGRCVKGKCSCVSGYEGESCATISCVNNCNNNGQCENGQCLCEEGYTGHDCFDVSPPKDLTVGKVTQDTVELSWANDMLVTEYLVTSTSSGDLYQEFTVPGDQTAATIKDLEPGIEYLINVYAVLNSKKSVPVSARVATLLPQLEGIRFTSVRETSVEVTWDKLESPFDGWEIFFRNMKEENGKIVNTVPPSQNQFVQSGLGPGQEYEVSINIIKNNTRGPQTSRRVTTRIEGPQQVQVKDVTASSALISWSKPVPPTDRVIMSYAPSSVPSDQTSVEIFSPDHQSSIDALRPDTEYTVSLVCRTSDSSSDPVNATFTTALDAPRDLHAVSQSDSTITVQWINSQADVESYRVKYSPISGATHGEELFPQEPGDITTATIIGLLPGTEYGIGVTAVKHERESIPATTNADTDLDPPKSFEKMESTETSLTLTWQKPKAKVTGYKLVYLSEDGQFEEFVLPATANTFVVPNLIAGTNYTFTLAAERGQKKSAPATVLASTPRRSTSPDVLSLTIKDAPSTPQSELDSGTIYAPDPRLLDSDKTSTNDLNVMGSGVEPDNSIMEELIFPNLTSTQLPDDTLPGRVTKDKIHKHKEYPLKGVVQENSSVFLYTPSLKEELNPLALNLTLSDITWDSLAASWGPMSEDFDSFVIEVTNMDNIAESQNLTLSGGAFSLVLSGLTPNTTYIVGLYGMYQGSFLEPTYSEATTVSEPVVGKLYVSDITSESFTMHWNGTEGQVDGFTLEIIDSDWLTEPQEYNMSRNVRSHDITGLRPSTDYIGYLYGMYKGSRSTAVSIVASTAEEPELSSLVVSNITSDRFTLSWQTQDRFFENFIVEVRESAVPSQAMGRVLPGDIHTTVMTGLKASTSYDIKLYTSSNDLSVQPLYAVAITEGIPQLGTIAASSVSPHNLSLSWNTLSGHFDGFVVRVIDSERHYDALEFTLPGNARNFTVSNLMDATDYDIELYGISHGRHTNSVLAQATTASLPKVENLTISNVTPYGFRVSWEVKLQQQQNSAVSSSGGFSHFNIVVTDSGWLLEPQEYRVPGDRSHLDISGLITGIGYEVRLTGVSESGLVSRPLTTVAVTEAEPEVEHLFVSDVTANSFRLSWTSDEDMFDRFLIKLRDSKRVAYPQEYSVHGDERTLVLKGLMGGTEYEIELYGIKLGWRSQGITGIAQTGLGTPQGLHFSEVTDSSAIVHWSKPQSPVDNYRITYVPFEGGSPLLLTVDGSVFEALLPNLTPGKIYQVTVNAVKGLEESDSSTDVLTTALDRPGHLNVVNITDASATLLWQPSVAKVDGYVITYRSDTAPPVVEHVTGSTVEFEMASLAPATLYTVALQAVKEAQKSDSAVTEFTTDVDPPRDLTVANIQMDSATLTWSPPQAAVTGYTLSFSSADATIREVVLSPTATSYNMDELTGSTEYTVQLMAIAGTQKSRAINAVFSTTGQLYRYPKDCAQIFLSGETDSGLYTIYVAGEESQPLQVYCDMTTDGGGWMVFLRRQNGKLEFFRNWKNYTAGFGNMNNEFWFGLSNLHKITSAGHYKLRVDLRDKGESAYAQYDKFTIAEPRTRYKIYIGAYSGTAGDSMTYHQGRPFSTYDNDNDIAVTNCALSYKGAFWYKNCHRVNLMGKYGDSTHSKGINWFHWKGHEHSIEFAEMKIRPADFRNGENRKKRS